MKIVIGSLTYPLPNGVTHSINTSINGFLEAGHDIMLIAPDYGTGSVRPEHYLVPGSKVSNTVIKFFGVMGKRELTFGLGARREIQRLTDQFQPDAYWLHQVTYLANTFERYALRSGLPTVLTYHTSMDYYGKIYAGELGEQTMIRRSVHVAESVDSVIAPSHYVKDKLQSWGVTKPIEVVSTGIEPVEESYSRQELRQRFKIPQNNKVLLFVGRVVKEKNISALLEMLRGVIKQEPATTLLLIGPGDLDETLAEARQLGVDKNVVLTGQLTQDETTKCYAGADLFVFASQSETQGLVIGEAMIVGLPVVALNSPIQLEVYPERAAAVVKTPSHFAEKVLAILSDKRQQRHLAEAGRKFVRENFSIEMMIAKQIGVFERTVASVEPSRRVSFDEVRA